MTACSFAQSRPRKVNPGVFRSALLYTKPSWTQCWQLTVLTLTSYLPISVLMFPPPVWVPSARIPFARLGDHLPSIPVNHDPRVAGLDHVNRYAMFLEQR